jgi:hypothetical protein
MILLSIYLHLRLYAGLLKVFGLGPAWYVSLEVASRQYVEAAGWDFYFAKDSKVEDVESGSL